MVDNKTQEMLKFGQEARKQSYPEEAGKSMMDMVFDPESGEFVMKGKNEPIAPDQVRTTFTDEGFAC